MKGGFDVGDRILLSCRAFAGISLRTGIRDILFLSYKVLTLVGLLAEEDSVGLLGYSLGP